MTPYFPELKVSASVPRGSEGDSSHSGARVSWEGETLAAHSDPAPSLGLKAGRRGWGRMGPQEGERRELVWGACPSLKK